MKTILKITQLSVLIAILISCNTRQISYEIKATLPESENGKSAYIYGDDYKLMDSTIVKDGAFQFSGTVKRPELVRVTVGNYSAEMILENAKYTTNLTSYNSYVLGGKINTLAYGYMADPEHIKANKAFYTIIQEYSKVDKLDKVANRDIQRRSEKEWKVCSDISMAHKKSILEGDYDSQTKLFVISRYGIRGDYTFKKIIALVDDFEKEFGKTSYSIRYREAIISIEKDRVSQKTVANGKHFKNIIAEDVNGVSSDLSEIVKKNKYTLLEMWASWCGPCRAQFPHLKKAYKEYHDKGFEIYALSMDTSKERWVKAMEEENVQWLNLVDYKAFKGEAALSYGVKGIPAAFLINSEGIIVASGNEARGFSLDEQLEILLEK